MPVIATAGTLNTSAVNQNQLLPSTGYLISRSLRLRSSASAYLTRTFSSSGNRTTWTYSAWVKRGIIQGSYQSILDVSPGNGPFRLQNNGANATTDVMQFYGFNGATFDFNVESFDIRRDPAAWYHVVLVFDSTNATSTDRIRFYVNGVRMTLRASTKNGGSDKGFPDQNFQGLINNSAQSLRIGTDPGSFFYDGLIAEVNFVDGQALTADSFGLYDKRGMWQPKSYTGSYGTNGFYLPFNNTSNIGADLSTFDYFMETAQLNGTSNGIQRGADLTGIANGKSGTVSMWWNFTGSASGTQMLWVSRNNATIGNTFQIYRSSTGGLFVGAQNASGTTILGAFTNGNPVFSAGLYHIYVTWDLNVSNRVNIYVNGSNQALTISVFTNDTIAYSQPNHGLGGDLFSPFAPTTPGMVGQVYVNYSAYLDPATNLSKFYGGTNLPVYLGLTGQIPSGSTPIVFLDGNATSILTNKGTGGNFSAFGTLSTGTTYNGTGKALRNNSFTPVNINVATANTTYDSFIDSPTDYNDGTVYGRGNYATLNPLNCTITALPTTLVDGNLKHTTTVGGAGSPGAFSYSTSTILMETGKYYAEFISNYASGSSGTNKVGLTNNFFYNYVSTHGYIASDFTSAYTQQAVGTLVQVAYDADAGLYWFGTNGTFTGNPAAGTGGTSLIGPAVFFVEGYNDNTNRIDVTANFGQRPFTYTPPAGFKALNTQNIKDPPIIFPEAHMKTTLYTGTGSNTSISNRNTNNQISFSPDLVWIKSRFGYTNNSISDSVRGPNSQLHTNNSTSQQTRTDVLTSFNTEGFSLGSFSDVNTSGNNYVAWQWKASKTSTVNNRGTISSNVAVNRQAGFSIVTYTGTGTTGTVGHGLDKAPDWILAKALDITESFSGSSNSWPYFNGPYSQINEFTKGVTFSLNSQSVSSVIQAFANTFPTSNVFTIAAANGTTGNANSINQSAQNYIAYCFTSVPGYSKFGIYRNNANTNGTFVYTGFKPEWILFHSSTVTSDHLIFDADRNIIPTGNVALLIANLPNTEITSANLTINSGAGIDILSNGFKIRSRLVPVGGSNNSGTVYHAFASTPYKFARG